MAQRTNQIAWSENADSGDLDASIQQKMRQLLNDFGIALNQEASLVNINFLAFPISREFNLLGAMASNDVFFAISPSQGEIPSYLWLDWRQKPHPYDVNELIVTVKQQYSWTNVWAVQFPNVVLDRNFPQREIMLQHAAKQWVSSVVKEIEKQTRVIKLSPIFNGRDFFVENDLCFVLVPFHEPFLHLYRDHIKPVIESQGFRVLKADDIFTPTVITEDVWQYINKARFVLADVTGKNPNVFYELGITHTVGKDTIILTQSEDDIPFDLRHLRHFTYTDDEAGWKVLRQNIEKAVRAIASK